MNILILLFISVGLQLSESRLLGKVLWKGKDKISPLGRLAILHQPFPVHFSSQAGDIPAEEISSIFSLALGYSVFKDLSWHGLLSGNPFARPKALVSFIISDIPAGEKISFHEATGFPLTVDGKTTNAEDIMVLGSTNTLANHISGTLDGKAMTVSVAASEEAASSGHSESENSITVFLNGKDNKWKYFDGGRLYEITQDSLDMVYQSANENEKPENVRLSSGANKMYIKMKDGEVSYDLSQELVKNFFNEIAAVIKVSEKALNNIQLISDGSTDVFTFFVTTLKGLSHVYGPDSAQVQAALKLVESIVQKITKRYNKAYYGNILVSAISLHDEKSVYTEDDIQRVYSKLKGNIEGIAFKNFRHDFPTLHLLRDVEEQARKSLCENVKGVLASFSGDLKFMCLNKEEAHHLQRRSLMATKGGTGVGKESGKKTDGDKLNLASHYDADFPVIFNIWFWLIVILALSVYVFSLVMWYMDPGKDSIIYRMTSQRIKTD